jgi:hypothetical protein
VSDLRTTAAVDLDRLLAASPADLVAEGLVRLDEVLIDGTKVRAAAGGGSSKTAALPSPQPTAETFTSSCAAMTEERGVFLRRITRNHAVSVVVCSTSLVHP